MVEEGFQELCVGVEVGIEARVQVVDVDPMARSTPPHGAAAATAAVMRRTKGKRKRRGREDCGLILIKSRGSFEKKASGRLGFDRY